LLAAKVSLPSQILAWLLAESAEAQEETMLHAAAANMAKM
jgi:hypothetical protein